MWLSAITRVLCSRVFAVVNAPDMRIAANAHIWTLNGDKQLIPIWSNTPHGSATPVDISLNSEQGVIALTGNPSSLPSGWKQVVRSPISSNECNLASSFQGFYLEN